MASTSESAVRAASVLRYGEALDDQDQAERWAATSATVDVDEWATQRSSTGVPADLVEWVTQSSTEPSADLAAWIEEGRRKAPAVEAEVVAPPPPKRDEEDANEKETLARLTSALAEKIARPFSYVRSMEDAVVPDSVPYPYVDDAAEAEAAAPPPPKRDEEDANEKLAPLPCTLDKETLARLTSALADKIARPFSYVRRLEGSVVRDSAPYPYVDDAVEAEAAAKERCKILLLDAFDDDAARQRLKEKGLSLMNDDDGARERVLRALSEPRARRQPAAAPTPAAVAVPMAVAVPLEDT